MTRLGLTKSTINPSGSSWLTIRRSCRAQGRSAAKGANASTSDESSSSSEKRRAKKEEQEAEVAGGDEVEGDYDDDDEEESWVDVGMDDLKELTVGVLEAVPGPRVGQSSMPWLVAVPLGYLGVTFVIAVIRTILKRRTPKFKRKRQIGNNALLNAELDQFLPEKRDTFTSSDLKKLAKKFGFTESEVLRKYVRFALNERPFSPEAVAGLIKLRQVSSLPGEEVAEVLNDISRRIVKAKGPVVLDTTGFTEKGIQRKVAVRAVFSKLLYLSEVEEFCPSSARDKLEVKAIFGVTDEDADAIRIVSLSSSDDLDRLEKSFGGGESGDSEDEGEDREDKKTN